MQDGLNSIHTALTILAHPGSTLALATDHSKFYNHLYTLLGRMAGVTDMSALTTDPRTSRLTELAEIYKHSRTPAAQAVTEYLRRSTIATNSTPTINQPDSDTPTDQPRLDRVSLDEAEQLTDSMLNCVNMLLVHRKRDVSHNRVLAVVKRMISTALSVVSA